MNTENINKIINLIKQEDNELDMCNIGIDYGDRGIRKFFSSDNVACIGGWVLRAINNPQGALTDETANYFNISSNIADTLCYPLNIHWSSITKEDAIIALEKVRDNENIDKNDIWNHHEY